MASSAHDFVEVGFSDVSDMTENMEKESNASSGILEGREDKTFSNAQLSMKPSEETSIDVDTNAETSENVNKTTNEISRASTMESSSIPAASANLNSQSHHRPNEDDCKTFFCNREGAFENAVENVRKQHIKVEDDGDVRGAWLLTHIDHWDAEKERLVLITDNWLMVIKYDFISLTVPEMTRIPLQLLDKIVVGDLTYPNASFMQKRGDPGVRAMWNSGQPTSFLHNWNPWSRQVPWITFTSHPLYSQNDRDSSTYNVQTFGEALCQAADQCKQRYNVSSATIVNSPIIIESYVGLASAFHNITGLGFFKVRGRVSF